MQRPVQQGNGCDPAWPMVGPVVVQGELKALGRGLGEASCPWTSLHQVDETGFSRSFVAPMAGLVHFHLTCGGTGTHQIRANGSASGPECLIELPAPGKPFRIALDGASGRISVIDISTSESILRDPNTPQSHSNASHGIGSPVTRQTPVFGENNPNTTLKSPSNLRCE